MQKFMGFLLLVLSIVHIEIDAEINFEEQLNSEDIEQILNSKSIDHSSLPYKSNIKAKAEQMDNNFRKNIVEGDTAGKPKKKFTDF